MSRLSFVALACLGAAMLNSETSGAESKTPAKYRVYFGTYTGASGSEGAYLAELDMASGKMTEPVLAGEVTNPSFLALHPNGRFLYAVSSIDTSDGNNTGGVSALSIDAKTGLLTLLNAQPCAGDGPCHLVVDHTGKSVLVANYGSGSVASLPIDKDGKLQQAASTHQHRGHSVNPDRQEGPHAHSINIDPGNRFAVAADLGLDQVLVYRLDPAAATLTPNDPPATNVEPGSGPRHFAFHPSGRFAYVINELANTVTGFDFNADRGELKVRQTISTLPDGYQETSYTAEVQAHPSGKFLYGSNRGHDSIAVFQIDVENGRLTAAGQTSTGGKTPRNFGLDPTGSFLLAANQDTNNVVIFRIHPETGALTPTGQSLTVPMPVCVKFLAIDP